MKQIVLGSGCFWCYQPIFEMVDGVENVEVGYAGGEESGQSYEKVSMGNTGHAEVYKITYDENKVSLEELLKIFFDVHNPTTLNRQGNDVGTQYRSVIFYDTEDENKIAEKIKKQVDESGNWEDPIVTEITKLKNYYKAEEYHQSYFAKNPNQGYCQVIIRPKMEKFEKGSK